mgnify:CR=1 FL=1
MEFVLDLVLVLDQATVLVVIPVLRSPVAELDWLGFPVSARSPSISVNLRGGRISGYAHLRQGFQAQQS